MFFFFFFMQKTAYEMRISDWSSDVCSSDLNLAIHDPLLRDGGRYGNFRSEGFRRTLAFYKEIFDKGWAPRVGNTAISNVWDEFGKGYFSFYINGPWNIAEFRKRLPSSLSYRSEEHTSELQSLMRNSYAVF